MDMPASAFYTLLEQAFKLDVTDKQSELQFALISGGLVKKQDIQRLQKELRVAAYDMLEEELTVDSSGINKLKKILG